jgi:hypothetical protein
LLTRLVAPRCVAKDSKAVVGSAKTFEDDTGQFGCPAGSVPEFQPIVDIHIGILTSSLTNGGSCITEALDDHARLILRARDASDVSIAAPRAEASNFLAWFPEAKNNQLKPKPEAPYGDLKSLVTSFQSLIRGVGERGCGYEAQLESVYRFLSQPDPFEKAERSEGGEGTTVALTGIDNMLLKQRHDFLRPDSLLAVVMVTDEDDASFDPLSFYGRGFLYAAPSFPDGRRLLAARGTSVCETQPNSEACMSCELALSASCVSEACKRGKEDPNCTKNGGYYTENEDRINVRTLDMKRRFGVDPLFPTARYVRGFTGRTVPDRSREHAGGNYVDSDLSANCTNPIFAKVLPAGSELKKDEAGKSFFAALASDGKPMMDADGKPMNICNLPRGERDPADVFFAVVAGVPNALLQKAPTEDALSDAQWGSILGRNPAKYDQESIDARMQPSTGMRPGRPTGPADSAASDPLNESHRDWDTLGEDLQYACTFSLPDALQKPMPKAANEIEQFDCRDKSDAPLCSGPKTVSGRKQVRAKAFPGLRELGIAHSLGAQGIAASICPIDTRDKASADYGYNPAVNSIVDRLRERLTAQCLPRPLTRDDQGQVSCLMLEVLPEAGKSCADIGQEVPEADIERLFRDQKKKDGVVLGKGSVCKIRQAVVSDGKGCQEGVTADGKDASRSWCYVTNKPESKCSQATEFGSKAIEQGAQVFIQCINQLAGGP